MAAIALITSIVPIVAIALTTRGGLRRRTLGIDLGLLVLIAAAASWARAAGLAVDGEAALYILLMARIGCWVVGAIHGPSEEVRWSAWRLAVIALLFHSTTLARVLEVPIDGDEPYYVLMTESLANDGDLDLRNQYAALESSVSNRTDLRPQEGDPVTESGAQRSRHEPFLAFLLLPGYFLGDLAGISSIILITAALLAWSVVRLLEDADLPVQGVVAGSALVVFAAPFVSYSVRIWPEIPAALCLSEGLRWGIRRRLLPSSLLLIAMSLLKLRFALIAAPLIVVLAWRNESARKRATLIGFAIAALAIPMLIVFFVSGSPLNVHRLDELLLLTPAAIARGLFGMMLDGQSGLLFVCPIALLALLATVRHGASWRGGLTMILCAAPYVILLSSRAEWHGGWSPPLRYLVVFAPIAALAVGRATAVWRLNGWMLLAWIGTFATAASAIAWPWQQFHVANGESSVGEMLSRTWGTDYSRLIPSYIRLNEAAMWGALAMVLLMIAVRLVRSVEPHFSIALLSLVLAGGAWLGRTPAGVVHFEDAHVSKSGGVLDPHQYTVARFLYDGGWRLDEGDTVSFLFSGGSGILRYRSERGATIDLGATRVRLEPSSAWRTSRIDLPPSRERHMFRVTAGEIVLESLRAR